MREAKPRSDALVFFGATGDLAYKKIFPALQSMLRRGHLDVPVVGVSRAGASLEQLRARVRASFAEHGGGVDEAAFAKLVSLLRYVDGDYNDPATFQALCRQLEGARRPLHYLADQLKRIAHRVCALDPGSHRAAASFHVEVKK